MIVFFDDSGNVNGCLQASSGVEGSALLSGNSSMALGGDLAKRLSDDNDPLQHYHLRIKNGAVEEISDKDKVKLKRQWIQAKNDHKEGLRRSANLL